MIYLLYVADFQSVHAFLGRFPYKEMPISNIFVAPRLLDIWFDWELLAATISILTMDGQRTVDRPTPVSLFPLLFNLMHDHRLEFRRPQTRHAIVGI